MLDEPQTHCTTLPLPGVFHQLSITFLDLFLNLLAVLPSQSQDEEMFTSPIAF